MVNIDNRLSKLTSRLFQTFMFFAHTTRLTPLLGIFYNNNNNNLHSSQYQFSDNKITTSSITTSTTTTRMNSHKRHTTNCSVQNNIPLPIVGVALVLTFLLLFIQIWSFCHCISHVNNNNNNNNNQHTHDDLTTSPLGAYTTMSHFFIFAHASPTLFTRHLFNSDSTTTTTSHDDDGTQKKEEPTTLTTQISNSDVLIIILTSTLGGICLFITLVSVIVISIYIYRQKKKRTEQEPSFHFSLEKGDATTPLLNKSHFNTSHQNGSTPITPITPIITTPTTTTITPPTTTTTITTTTTSIFKHSHPLKKINLQLIKEGMIKSCIQDREGILIKSAIAKDLPRLVKKTILYFNHSELFSLLENETIRVNSNHLKLDSKDVNDINMICCRFLADLSKCVNIGSVHEHYHSSLSDEDVLSSFSCHSDSTPFMNGSMTMMRMNGHDEPIMSMEMNGQQQQQQNMSDLLHGQQQQQNMSESHFRLVDSRDASSSGGGGVDDHQDSITNRFESHDRTNTTSTAIETTIETAIETTPMEFQTQQQLTLEEYHRMVTFQKKRKSTLMLIRALNHVRNRTLNPHALLDDESSPSSSSNLALNIQNFESFSIFLKETFGENSPVVHVLKLCSQTALFEGLNQIRPALLDMGIMFKDFRGRNWIVKIYTNSHHERPLIIHERIEQVINMQLQPLYTFTYQLQIEMDEEFETVTDVNVKLLNIDFSKNSILSEMEQQVHENKLKLVMDSCRP